MTTSRIGPVICLGSLLYAGCGVDVDPASFTVADSAGVRIVESRTPVDSESDIEVGEVTLSIGGPGSELSRVVGALRLSDGRIVIADGGNHSIRFFSPAGAFLASVGGEGDGPAEFRLLQAIGRLPGDTVWAYDFSHRRVLFVAPDMNVARSIRLHPPLTSGLAVGVLPTGAVLLGESWSSARVATQSSAGFKREPVAYVRYSSSGALLDTVGLFPGREVLVSQENGRGVMSSAPLGRSAAHAFLGDAFVMGDQVGHEVRVFSPAGKLLRIVRWNGGDLGVGSELRSTWQASRIRAAPPEARASVRREVAEAVLPERRPSYGSVLPSPDGGLWIGDYQVDGTEPLIWEVFDSAGVWRSTLRMPRRFRPLQIGTGWILGVSRDAHDVQHVELRPCPGCPLTGSLGSLGQTM